MNEKPQTVAELIAAIQALKTDPEPSDVVCKTYLSKNGQAVGKLLSAVSKLAKGAPLPACLLPPVA